VKNVVFFKIPLFLEIISSSFWISWKTKLSYE
jgi:hypothetical protein